MDETVPVTAETKRGFWAWLSLFAQFAGVIALAIYGAAVASAGAAAGDDTSGLILTLASIALGFLRLKSMFDGTSAWLGDFVLVESMRGLGVAVPVFTVLGLAGLFLARGAEEGSLHAAGIGLFVASGVIVFLDLKRVFDRIDSRGH